MAGKKSGAPNKRGKRNTKHTTKENVPSGEKNSTPAAAPKKPRLIIISGDKLLHQGKTINDLLVTAVKRPPHDFDDWEFEDQFAWLKKHQPAYVNVEAAEEAFRSSVVRPFLSKALKDSAEKAKAAFESHLKKLKRGPVKKSLAEMVDHTTRMLDYFQEQRRLAESRGFVITPSGRIRGFSDMKAGDTATIHWTDFLDSSTPCENCKHAKSEHKGPKGECTNVYGAHWHKENQAPCECTQYVPQDFHALCDHCDCEYQHHEHGGGACTHCGSGACPEFTHSVTVIRRGANLNICAQCKHLEIDHKDGAQCQVKYAGERCKCKRFAERKMTMRKQLGKNICACSHEYMDHIDGGECNKLSCGCEEFSPVQQLPKLIRIPGVTLEYDTQSGIIWVNGAAHCMLRICRIPKPVDIRQPGNIIDVTMGHNAQATPSAKQPSMKMPGNFGTTLLAVKTETGEFTICGQFRGAQVYVPESVDWSVAAERLRAAGWSFFTGRHFVAGPGVHYVEQDHVPQRRPQIDFQSPPTEQRLRVEGGYHALKQLIEHCHAHTIPIDEDQVYGYMLRTAKVLEELGGPAVKHSDVEAARAAFNKKARRGKGMP